MKWPGFMPTNPFACLPILHSIASRPEMKKHLTGFVRNALILCLGVAITAAPMLLQAQSPAASSKALVDASQLPLHVGIGKHNPHDIASHFLKFLRAEVNEKESEEDESESNLSKRARNRLHAESAFAAKVSIELHYHSSHRTQQGNRCAPTDVPLTILNGVFRI